MASRALKIILTAVIATVVGGCGKPPKCSDDDTLSLIRPIILDQIGGNEAIASQTADGEALTEKEIQENLKIELPRADAFDEKIKKYSCTAKLVAGDMYQLPIAYESQLDDKDQHIVAVRGISRGDLLHVQAGVIEGIRKARSEKSNAAQSAAPNSMQTEAEQVSAPINSVTPSSPTQLPNPEAPKNTSEATLAPSFDCRKASSLAEKAVCADPLLGKLDGALSENYKYMLASDIGDDARINLKATQKKWFSERNKCADNRCLESSYRKRIGEVCEYPVLSGTHPACTSSDEIE